MTQEAEATEDREVTGKIFKRLSKNEVKNTTPLDVNIHSYTGPRNPPMPHSEASNEVLSLRVLAHQVVSLQHAQHLDFMFLKSIISVEGTPEYNGFNVKHARETGWNTQPATHVKYLPMINMYLSDPATILTSMYEVKRLTEEAGQSYTIFTNDQQLYKVTVQMTWWHPT